MKILNKHQTCVRTLRDLVHFSSQVPANCEVISRGKEGCSRDAGGVCPDFSRWDRPAARPAGEMLRAGTKALRGAVDLGCSCLAKREGGLTRSSANDFLLK